MTAQVLSNKNERAFLTAPPSLEQEFRLSTTQIQDHEGKAFSIVPVYSLEEFLQIPEDIHPDYRVTKEDTEQSLSCFKGIALDPNFTRIQTFLIKDGQMCIGVATLIVVPYKNRMRDIYFKRIGNKLITQPFAELFHSQPGFFVIETGWMKILPQYRHKKLGESIITHVLLPTIERLCSQACEEIIIKCSPAGRLEGTLKERIVKVFKESLSQGSREVLITQEMEPYFDQVHPEAMFTSNQARKYHFDRLSEVFSSSLGPVFAKVITHGSRQ